MNLDVLRKLSEGRSGGLKKIATDIGMSEANLHRCINNNKIQASDLEKIALLLNVDIGVFFDYAVSGRGNAIANGYSSVAAVNSEVSMTGELSLSQKIKYLEQLLAEKERTIQILMNK